MSEAPHICLRARITGRVQGVWYRAWTRETAQRLGLGGWVQNLPDGAVLAQFVGPEAAVAAMIEACRTGPRDARVAAVETEPVEPVPPLAAFRINR
ncbi:acylphosphatase [Paralimibaculum aggregatum]|uniref:acylphosphatase n=1 Tax=Paralimibaculum aggregatum TaxID=3036245 RepID=A0ABQ6LLU8_9RHOB|nr:acylphosphatase [Limibaculum sp. NKW23]GMG81265.1 acylphosphatase [Limibaculum sp. NKW23]